MSHYRRPREHWLLPDSRAAWFLQVAAAVMIGYGIAALAIWWIK